MYAWEHWSHEVTRASVTWLQERLCMHSLHWQAREVRETMSKSQGAETVDSISMAGANLDKWRNGTDSSTMNKMCIIQGATIEARSEESAQSHEP